MHILAKRRLGRIAIAIAVLCVLGGGVWLWRFVGAGRAVAALMEIAIPIPEGAVNADEGVRGGVREIRFEFSSAGANQPILEFYRDELGKTGWQPYEAPWVSSPGEWSEGPVSFGEMGRSANGSATPTGDVLRTYQYAWHHPGHGLLAILVVHDTSGWRDELAGLASSAGLSVTLRLLDRASMERLMDLGSASWGPRKHK